MVSTILYRQHKQQSHSSRILHVVDIRKLVITRFATSRIPEKRTVPCRFMPLIVFEVSVACLRSPETHEIEISGLSSQENETQKWRQNGCVTDEIAYVPQNNFIWATSLICSLLWPG